MIELLQNLIRIPSISREEAAACDFLQSYLTEAGYCVHRTGNNLWMESEPSGCRPSILLNAHIDTVKPCSGYTRDPFSPDIEGDFLFGLGSNDDGGSLVALLEAWRILTSRPQPYRLVCSFTAEEEVTGTGGIEAILGEVGKIDLGIIGEPTGMDVAIAEKGLMVLDCATTGRSGHAAREEGINAIYKAMESIDWFRNYRFEKVSEFCGPVKMTVTQINAGTQHNVVPDKCTFVVDVRGNGLYDNASILEEIRRNVTCEVTPRSTRLNGSSISPSHPAVVKAVSLGMKTFGSPTLSNQSVCPFDTLKLGPGESSRSHSADEFIRISEITSAVDLYVRLLDGLTL